MQENLEFNFETIFVEMPVVEKTQASNAHFSTLESPIQFTIKLDQDSRTLHDLALFRAQKYLIAEAELLEVIMQIDSLKLYEKFHQTHLTPYCVKHLGLSEDVAANFVRVARKSLQVPALKQAIDEGRLSVTKAKTISSVITLSNQEGWIQKAETLGKDKLEKAVAYANPKTKEPEKAKFKGPNRIRVEFELTEEEMSLFRRAQDIASQKKSKSLTLAETQVELLKLYLERHDPIEKAKRSKARRQKQENQTPLEKGEQSSNASSNKRFQKKSLNKSLDKSLNKKPNLIIEKAQLTTRERSWDRRPTKRPAIAASVIHAVNLRDQGRCQARLADGSICSQTRWVQFHHLQPKAKGGKDQPENLITLCSAHHRLWHRHHEE